MKHVYLLPLIVLIFSNSFSQSQIFTKDSSLVNFSDKTQILSLKSNLKLSEMIKIDLSKGDMLQIAGGICAVAFLSSVIIFKQDIFSTFPMLLLASSILLVFLGSNVY